MHMSAFDPKRTSSLNRHTSLPTINRYEIAWVGAIGMAETRIERRLAAILAVDVAGDSQLMGVDGECTLAARLPARTHRSKDCGASRPHPADSSLCLNLYGDG